MDEAVWYYAKNGQRLGPFTLGQMLQFAKTGILEPADLAWSGDARNAAPATGIPGAFAGRKVYAPSRIPPAPVSGVPVPEPEPRKRQPPNYWSVALPMAGLAFMGCFVGGSFSSPLMAAIAGGSLCGFACLAAAMSNAGSYRDGFRLIAVAVLIGSSAALITNSVRHLGLGLGLAVPPMAILGVIYRKQLEFMRQFE